MTLNSFTSNQGTQTALLTDNTGGASGTLIPVMKLDVSPQGTAGTVWNGNVGAQGIQASGAVGTQNPVIFGGTNAQGTIFAALVDSAGHLKFDLLTGTINNGSIVVTAGTVRPDARTTQNIVTFGTQVSGTAAIAATIIGSASIGAGTSLWLQDVSVTNNNANVLCVLGFGTAQQGTNVLLRHTLGTSGAVGIEKTFGKLVNAGMTNQDLVFSLGAAGTVDLTFSYLISA